jgi:hypothetical protein
LYLRVTVGRTGYLVTAAELTDVSPEEGGNAAANAVDCRVLFDQPVATPGYRVTFRQNTGASSAIIVDQLNGLVELDEDTFRALPPIGQFGAIIDAVSVPVAGEAPALRLRISSALLAAAAGREPTP